MTTALKWAKFVAYTSLVFLSLSLCLPAVDSTSQTVDGATLVYLNVLYFTCSSDCKSVSARFLRNKAVHSSGQSYSPLALMFAHMPVSYGVMQTQFLSIVTPSCSSMYRLTIVSASRYPHALLDNSTLSM